MSFRLPYKGKKVVLSKEWTKDNNICLLLVWCRLKDRKYCLFQRRKWHLCWSSVSLLEKSLTRSTKQATSYSKKELLILIIFHARSTTIDSKPMQWWHLIVWWLRGSRTCLNSKVCMIVWIQRLPITKAINELTDSSGGLGFVRKHHVEGRYLNIMPWFSMREEDFA